MCGFANAQGGIIVIGKKDDGTPFGLTTSRKLMEDLPNKIREACRIAEIPPPILRNDMGGIWIEFTLPSQPIPESSPETSEKTPETSEKTSEKTPEASEKTSEKIILLIGRNPTITIAELADKLGITGRSVERNIEKLKNEGKLIRIGPDKGGIWKLET